jgi:hypothetical protein
LVSWCVYVTLWGIPWVVLLFLVYNGVN